jgi:hypothetical protein
MAMLCKKITAAKSKEVKTGCNLAESSKEGYGSKRAVASDDDEQKTHSAHTKCIPVYCSIAHELKGTGMKTKTISVGCMVKFIISF